MRFNTFTAKMYIRRGLLLAVFCYLGYTLYYVIDQPDERRSTVSQVRSDQRSMATAIEAYYIDNNSYPAGRPLTSLNFHNDELEKAGGDKLNFTEPGGWNCNGLTTPVAYISSYPRDPFFLPDVKKGGLPFAYYADLNGWILFSPGPDRDYDLVPERDYTSSVPQPSDHLLVTATYDPTNGTISDGDVWRVKQ